MCAQRSSMGTDTKGDCQREGQSQPRRTLRRTGQAWDQARPKPPRFHSVDLPAEADTPPQNNQVRLEPSFRAGLLFVQLDDRSSTPLPLDDRIKTARWSDIIFSPIGAKIKNKIPFQTAYSARATTKQHVSNMLQTCFKYVSIRCCFVVATALICTCWCGKRRLKIASYYQ